MLNDFDFTIASNAFWRPSSYKVFKGQPAGMVSMISFYCLRAVLIVHTFIDADNDCKNFSMCSDLSKINCYKCFSKYK